MILRIFLRHLQMFDEKNNPIYYNGTNPNNLQVIQGLVPQTEWIEFTEDVEDLETLDFSWRLKESGSSGKGASNVDRGSSGEMTFTNKAYKFVMHWLNEHPASALNGIEVMIKTDSGIFRDWVIKNDGLEYCDTDTCRISLSMRQKDDVYSCIQTTMITDNHSGMFSGKYEHPRFAYCNEFRPAGVLTALFSLVALVGFIALVLAFPIHLVIKVVRMIVGAVKWLSRGIRRFHGELKEAEKATSPRGMQNTFVKLLIAISGCGREHPAPLIRDYISNVCAKCGIQVTPHSASIFFDPKSDYYNLTMLSAETKKGIKDDNHSEYWIPDNDPLLTLDMLLDKLKPLFNAEWKIRNNTLYFHRHDEDDKKEFIYDFINADKNLIIDGICYSWSERKKKAYARMGYVMDGFDNLTSDTKSRFNDIVEFNKPINPLLEGEDNKIVNDFCMARFRQDGIQEDYITDALKGMFAIVVISLGTAQIILHRFKDYLQGKKGCLVMQNHTTMFPKLIIWDGKSKRNAKAKYWHTFNVNEPIPNPIYNDKPYKEIHPEDERRDSYYNENCKLYNYPMSFDAKFTGNLYDRFHQIDDPRVNPPMNKKFKLKIPLCTADILKLGLYDDGDIKGLGAKVKLNAGTYYKEGKITEINVNFDPTDKLGRYIELKGIV